MPVLNEMVKEITISAPPERVFRAITEADQLGSWMAQSAESDPVPGGVFKLNWTQFGMTGVYREVVTNARVVAEGDGWETGMASIVTYQLTPSGDGTHVTLTNRGVAGPAWDAMYEGVSAGWDIALRDLKSWVETGAVEPGGFRGA